MPGYRSQVVFHHARFYTKGAYAEPGNDMKLLVSFCLVLFPRIFGLTDKTQQ